VHTGILLHGKPNTSRFNIKMLSRILAATALLGAVNAQSPTRAQGPPPPPVLLNATKSGVLPVLPTPFNGVDTLEGAIINPGPVNPGFTGLGGTATKQMNLPAATYMATLPDSMFDPLVGSVIQGSVMAVGTDAGVQFMVNLTGLPNQATYGPFPWHIHAMPVPADGNCTETLGHLDPTNRGELYMCDATAPETCQVGDLAGKHGGKIMAEGSFMTSFVDPYLSTDPSSPAYFGGLGFVIHTGNTTRLTCANFEMMNGSMPMPMPNGTMGMPSGTMMGPTPTGSGPEFTGAATKMGATVGGMIAAGVLALVV
jgi:hypothetical protein